MLRFLPRVLSALALAAVPLLLVPLSASAADLDPLLRYEGSLIAVSDGESEPVTVSLLVDCTNQPCLMTGSAGDASFTADLFGGGVPVVDGAVDSFLPATGDPCAIGSYHADITVTGRVDATAVTLVIDFTGTGEVDCPDGTSVEYSAAHIEGPVPYLSGSACLLDDSCAPEATPTPTPTAVDVVAARPADDPSVLSTLATPREAFTPRNLAWAAAGSIVLALLVALPTTLLDAAVERLTARSPQPVTRPARFSGWLLAIAGLGVSAIASTFVDPRVGVDVAGVRTFAEVLLSIAIAIGVGWLVVILLARVLHPSVPTRLELRPLSLVIVAAAVLFSRLTGFEPGIVFGLVAGVVVGTMLAKAEQARLALIGIGWGFGIGIVAWLAYGLMPATVDGGELFVRETLAGIAVAGLSALPIALLPVRSLTGHAIWLAGRVRWAIVYAIALCAFLLVLLPLPASWDRVDADLTTWVALYVAYALAAVLVWLVVIRPWRRPA